MLLNPLSRWLYLIALIFITSDKIQCQNIAETDNIQPFNQSKLIINLPSWRLLDSGGKAARNIGTCSA